MHADESHRATPHHRAVFTDWRYMHEHRSCTTLSLSHDMHRVGWCGSSVPVGLGDMQGRNTTHPVTECAMTSVSCWRRERGAGGRERGGGRRAEAGGWEGTAGKSTTRNVVWWLVSWGHWTWGEVCSVDAVRRTVRRSVREHRTPSRYCGGPP